MKRCHDVGYDTRTFQQRKAMSLCVATIPAGVAGPVGVVGEAGGAHGGKSAKSYPAGGSGRRA
ncbi:MAG: hypothetical protein ABEJ05_06590 [Haloglomus sp.]